VFERAQGSDIQLGDSPGQHVNPIPFAYSESLKSVGKTISLLLKLTVGVILDFAVLPEPPNGETIASGAIHMPIDGFVCNVQSTTARKPL
jgi:hypothetical protein